MTSAALKVAHAINYEGAGTIEFIVDGSGPLREDGFWFMEMNTRLQVEHPVTEIVTGLDLVEWQIRVAQGEILPCTQEQIRLAGHAFEARVYAEDPASDFLPSTGTLDALAFGPARIDTGVDAGDTVSPFYDPMIAKVISSGETREEARRTLINALAQTAIFGLKSNIDFLAALANDPEFVSGTPDTGLIERRGTELTQPDTDESFLDAIAAGLVHIYAAESQGHPNWRLWGDTLERVFLIRADERRISADLKVGSDGAVQITIQDRKFDLGSLQLRDGKLSFATNGIHQSAYAWRLETMLGVIFGVGYNNAIRLYRAADLLDIETAAELSSDDVSAPMTGLVRTVEVSQGDVVTLGQSLGVIEAMKMEHTLKAPRDGEIALVECAVDDQVEGGTVLFRLAKVEE